MRAAQSHTASVAGTAAVNSAVFRQFGAIEVDDLDQLLAVSQLLTRASAKSGNGLCIYTFSGGTAALAADLAGAARLPMAGLAPATQAALAALLPDFASIGNPVDTTADILRNPEASAECLRILCADPSVGTVLYPIPMDYGAITDAMAESIVSVASRTDTLIVPVWMSRRLSAGYLRDGTGGPAALPVAVGRHRRPVRAIAWKAEPAPPPPCPRRPATRARSAADAKAMLRDAGCPCPPDGSRAAPTRPPPMPPRWAFRGHESGQRRSRTRPRPAASGWASPRKTRRARPMPPSTKPWRATPRRPHRRRAGRAHAAAGRARGADRRAPRRGLRPGDDFRPGRHLRRDPARRGAPHDPALEALILRVSDFAILRVSDFAWQHRDTLHELELNPVWVGAAGRARCRWSAAGQGRCRWTHCSPSRARRGPTDHYREHHGLLAGFHPDRIAGFAAPLPERGSRAHRRPLRGRGPHGAAGNAARHARLRPAGRHAAGTGRRLRPASRPTAC